MRLINLLVRFWKEYASKTWRYLTSLFVVLSANSFSKRIQNRLSGLTSRVVRVLAQITRYSHRRYASASMLTMLIIFSLLIQMFQFIPISRSDLISDAVQRILSSEPEVFADKLVYDSTTQSYKYNQQYTPNGNKLGSNASAYVNATFPVDSKDGVELIDPNNSLGIKFIPEFELGRAVREGGRIVYRLSKYDGLKVITPSLIGYKEDIVLNEFQRDELEFSYKMELPNEVEPRIESDGSIGFYGPSAILLGDVKTGNDEDKKLLDSARANSEKTNLIFRIPAPVIVDSYKVKHNDNVEYKIAGDKLTIKSTELESLAYPISIDPSIYVETARNYIRFNNESNVNFDSTNEQFRLANESGGTPGLFTEEGSLSHPTTSGGGTVSSGGKLYSLAGKSNVLPHIATSVFQTEGTHSLGVPVGVDEVFVEAWGAGGGGGGAGSHASISEGGDGGGGAYASSFLGVTGGETLSIKVGGGGTAGVFSSQTAGAGNSTAHGSGDGGGGGGHSEVERSGSPLIIAAGGGGGGGGDNSSSLDGGNGGAGGTTLNGATGSASGLANGGGGGTNSAGGAGGSGGGNPGSAGSSEQGGGGADGRIAPGADGTIANGGTNGGGGGGTADVEYTPGSDSLSGYAGGGGGGGGYYGGGGGSGSATGNVGGGGGGGGTSHVTGYTITVNAGSGVTPGNSGSAYRNGAGAGGNGGAALKAAGTNGSDGKVIIYYEVPDSAQAVYDESGSDTFNVPEGVSEISVLAWGAGGGGAGGGSNAQSDGGAGGSGAYIEATFSVSGGDVLNINVGSGGKKGNFSSSSGSSYSGDGGGGGGYSIVSKDGTNLVIAGAGGGGGGGDNNTTLDGGAGGGGGDLTSGNSGGASNTALGGGGGTNSAGGSGGTGGANTGTVGSSLQGGAGADGRSSEGTDGSMANNGLPGGGAGGIADASFTYAGGGGGGGGYYGGGGGSGSVNNSAGGGGGGGGSSYIDASATDTTVIAGSSSGSSVPSLAYGVDAGIGGAGGASVSSGTDGKDGLIVIFYEDADAGSPTSGVSWSNVDGNDGSIDSPNPGNGACGNWCGSADYGLPVALKGFSSTIYNGYIYVIGGEDNSGNRVDSVYIAKIGPTGEPSLWHPTDSDPDNWVYWYEDTSYPEGVKHAAVVARGDYLYILGGETDSEATGSDDVNFAEINPDGTLESWTSVGVSVMPEARIMHTAETIGDRIYILAGDSLGTLIDDVDSVAINSDGTFNGSWRAEADLNEAKRTEGGDFSTTIGSYIYLAGGCSDTDANDCREVSSKLEYALLESDGSIGQWMSKESPQIAEHDLIAAEGRLYVTNGCETYALTPGICTSYSETISVADIESGDLAIKWEGSSGGSGTCNGATPYNCELPTFGTGATQLGAADHLSFALNGYLYVIGGCTAVDCTAGSSNIGFAKIEANGNLSKPATCSGTYYYMWCIDSTNQVELIDGSVSGMMMGASTIFENTIYLHGAYGRYGSPYIYRNTVNPSTGNLTGSWQYQNVTDIGLPGDLTDSFMFARANPGSEDTSPGNFYLFSGCFSKDSRSCNSIASGTYKCNIATDGTINGCSTTGQLAVDSIPGGSNQGVYGMEGVVYGDYVYLAGGRSGSGTNLNTIVYAKFDGSNNIVPVDGESTWAVAGTMNIERGYNFGAFVVNGSLYVVGGALGDTSASNPYIEFAQFNNNGTLSDFKISGVQPYDYSQNRYGNSAVYANGHAYVFSGCTATSVSSCTFASDGMTALYVPTFSSSLNSFNSSANSFDDTANRVGASAAILDGEIYVAGGESGGSYTGNVQVATLNSDGSIGTWSSTSAELPSGRAYGNLEVAGGSLYYIGGEKTVCEPTGDHLYKRWDGISGGSPSDLYADGNYPDSPTSSATVSSGLLEIANGFNGSYHDDGDNFAATIEAIICPQQTGDYTFWVSNDDAGELWLSTDETRANRVSIVESLLWTNYGEWDKYTEQQSSPVTLEAGKYYYLEAVMKEAGGGDHIQVGWTKPDETFEGPIADDFSLPSETASVTTSAADDVYFATPSGGDIDDWTVASNNLPEALSNSGATVVDDRIYVAGGIDSAGAVSDAVFVSPQLSSGGDIGSAWTSDPETLPSARSGLSMTNYGGNLYFVGGNDDTDYMSDMHYSGIDETDGSLLGWSQGDSLPAPVSGGHLIADSGHLFLTGGRINDSTCTTETFALQLVANDDTDSSPQGTAEWQSSLARLTGAREYAAGAYDAENNYSYILGGGCASELTSNQHYYYSTPSYSDGVRDASFSYYIDADDDVELNNVNFNGGSSGSTNWSARYKTSTESDAEWGQSTDLGTIAFGQNEDLAPKNASGSSTTYARYIKLDVTYSGAGSFGDGQFFPHEIDTGYIDELGVEFAPNPGKRLRGGATFINGQKQPLHTPSD